MKLVDILARELKVWPFEEDALGQAEDGSLHSEPYADSRKLEKYTRADDWRSAVIKRAQWQAAVDALKAGKQAWNGEGLPPVGTVCEYNWHGAWSEGTVVALVDGGLDCEEAIIQLNGDWAFAKNPGLFRPIRTAEQIAADDQSAQINRMINESLEGVAGVTIAQARTICSQLHKAGYRKQVQP